jgi:hypothetical protein
MDKQALIYEQTCKQGDVECTVVRKDVERYVSFCVGTYSTSTQASNHSDPAVELEGSTPF